MTIGEKIIADGVEGLARWCSSEAKCPPTRLCEWFCKRQGVPDGCFECWLAYLNKTEDGEND